MRYFVVIVFMVLLLITLIKGQREGDLCVVTGTIQPGVCRHISKCSVALEAALHGKPPQVCASPENVMIVCCPWVPGQETRLQDRYQANMTTPREGDNCTMVDTGRAGVCSRFANCQTAREAAYKSVSSQICVVEGTLQIVCCPLVTLAEGDRCSIAETGRAGKCLRISKCPVAVEAALKGITPQICALDGSVPVVCCEGVIEGDNCTMIDTGRAGVCSRFSNCQTAKEAAYKGISPQICALDDAIQIVCCPSVTAIEGDNCTMVDTGKAGVCSRFANCQTAKEAASKGVLPQTCDVDSSNQIVCCPLVTVSEGSKCTLKRTGMAGVCKPFANCQTAKEAAYKGIFQQKCDSTDSESELVCCTETNCPPLPKGLVTELPKGSKAADYCIELAEKIHPCQETPSGWTRGDTCPQLTPDSNIEYHNTPVTTAAEAPYYGLIGFSNRGNITWSETPVTLVSDQWLLSSNTEWIGEKRGGRFSRVMQGCEILFPVEEISIGNCLGLSKVQNIGFLKQYYRLGSSWNAHVGLGGTFTPQYNPDEIYGVTKQINHPLYNSSFSKAYNTIALLRLDRQVIFTSRILPACLHTGTPLPDSGFILTGPVSPSKTDYKTSMQRVSQEECSRVFSTDSNHHPAGIKHDVEICSRPVNTTGECLNWFNGAPFTLPNSHRVVCTHLLVGLKSTSNISPCTYTNTRISGFIPWIEGIVWPESGVVV